MSYYKNENISIGEKKNTKWNYQLYTKKPVGRRFFTRYLKECLFSLWNKCIFKISSKFAQFECLKDFFLFSNYVCVYFVEMLWHFE